jgi:hypothetical protein
MFITSKRKSGILFHAGTTAHCAAALAIQACVKAAAFELPLWQRNLKDE